MTQGDHETLVREAIAAEGARHDRYRRVLLTAAKGAAAQLRDVEYDAENIRKQARAARIEFETVVAGIEAELVKPLVLAAPDPAVVSG